MKRFAFTAFLLTAATLFGLSTAEVPMPAPIPTPTATLTLGADSDETFTSGGTLTFTATATDYPENTSALAWAVTLPEGWAYVSDDGSVDLSPSVGTTDLLEWAYFNVPTAPASFTFTVSYPADVTVDTEVTAEVIIRTEDTPDATTLPVDPVAFTPAPSLDNGITFPAIGTKRANDPSFTLDATSPSGLPITYTVVSGPAMISGNVVTLTGATGAVVIRAEQGGDLYYVPADAVSQTFNVVPAGPLIYFGTTSEGTDFAVQIPAGQTTGTLFGTIASTGQFYILTFQVQNNNTVTAISLQVLGNPSTAAAALAFNSLRKRTGADQPRQSAADMAYTFTGSVANGTLNLQIAELGITLTGTLEPADGPTAPLAGLYESSSVNSASGTVSSIVGTTGKVYVLAVTPTIIGGGAGTIATNGSFSVTTANNLTINGAVDAASTTVTGTIVLPDGSTDAFAGLSTGTTRTDRLVNLSTRAYVNGSPLITGFVIGGDQPKRVLLRAVGPTLADYGIDNPVADPRITLFDAAGSELMSSDTWSDDANAAMAATVTGAFPLPEGSLDAALVTELAPGVYTLHVNHTGAGGIAIAEIYDAAENPNSEYQRLVNISSRGDVTSGEGVLIGGFIVTGNSPKRVLVRGIGPGLAAQGVSGVLMDPQVKVYNADRQVVAANDDWQTATPVFAGQRTATATEITTANTTLGAFALADGAADAGLIVTLAPGAYTVELSASADGEQGNALIEIYELPE
ncbi:hypothetical protein [Actomonas aquatica]|uniref:MBG domain-containing protein n=1 Tax=Actomonas aquatica TaxID=2866162 RepID=A0ABZ1CAP5_9BACT|nr:hypothetical protein [Opitutus sp. WL0086]WRQ88669.1 hypothetical protein K1X11_004585 [Opitutus sp. WL0086]